MRAIQLFLLACASTPAGAAATINCAANAQYLLDFRTATAATLNYANSYSYTAANALGQTMTVTVSFVANGLSSSLVNSTQMPAITTLINDGGTTNRNLMVGGVFSARTTSITSGTRTIATNFAFPSAVRDLEVQVNDVDFTTNQYRDWFWAGGKNGTTTYVPGIVTPFGTNNAAGAKTNASSSLALGAATTPFSQTASEAVGTGASDNNATTGTLSASWIQPVTSASLIYGNYPLQSGETVTGQQGIGFQTLTFCAMPQLVVTKTSTPFSDPVNNTTNPKLIPGGDVSYAITLANSGGSDLDVSTILADDTLPATVTFYNGNYDGSTLGPFQFAMTGGATISGGAATYSSTGAAPFSYTPAAGYDAAVKALRMTGSGTIPPGGTVVVRFRTRIK